MTPGQVAYETAVAVGETTTITWDELPMMRRRAWEAIGRAILEAAP